MEEDSLHYWIIPIFCMVAVMGVVFPFLIHHQQTVVFPNAAIELDKLKNIPCDELSARNALGSYWTPNNGKFARDKVDDCKDIKESHEKNLDNIRREGTHQEKLDAGFTKLWFGVYDHPDLPFLQKSVLVKILPGTINNSDLFPKQMTVIIGYNNTLRFENLDDIPYNIQENFGSWSTGNIFTNETSSVTVINAGEYGYYANPWLTGTLTVLES